MRDVCLHVYYHLLLAGNRDLNNLFILAHMTFNTLIVQKVQNLTFVL
jgi:hypothetical protein